MILGIYYSFLHLPQKIEFILMGSEMLVASCLASYTLLPSAAGTTLRQDDAS